jgi:hypothetical protein
MNGTMITVDADAVAYAIATRAIDAKPRERNKHSDEAKSGHLRGERESSW